MSENLSKTDQPTSEGGHREEIDWRYRSWGTFIMTPDGLFQKTKPDAEPSWISESFGIIGLARDPDSNGWGLMLRWNDPDGCEHVRHIANAAIQRDPMALCAMLADGGLQVHRSKRQLLADYAIGVELKERVTVVERTGWAEIKGRKVFILPKSIIGESADESVVLVGIGKSPYSSHGSLEEWKTGIGRLAADHANMILAISAALAGPLLFLTGQEGGGIHFVGGSSKGKTTILQAAASVWGSGGSSGFVRSWRTTANALESAAATSSDTVLILDELGQVDGKDAAAALYSLSNGIGKSRSTRDGGLREPKSWRVMVLSSGELPIEAKLSEEKGQRARAGQMVRMLDVPVDRGFGYGAFDSPGHDNDPANLAQLFKLASSRAYGTAGPAFVRLLIEKTVSGDHGRSRVCEFVERYSPPEADGQIIRAAQRFGLLAAAGEYAIEFDIVPWEIGKPTDTNGAFT